jgi:GH15 family glucan-1,4-alpha-glucosidase
VTRASGGDLQVLYGVRGRTEIPEVELGYLSGYRASRPVRIGNAAAHQFQLDVYGEVVDSYYLFRDALGKDRESDLRWAYRIVDHAARVWSNPDEGIWEVRGGPRHFVYSKAMAWAALHRGASLARAYGGGDPERWDGLAHQIAAQIFERGFDASRGVFVQAYDGKSLDASVLRLPLIGFIDANDPRMCSTIDAVMRDLTKDGLVYRYTDRDDGLPGGEGTFAICTFWLVQALTLCGRQREAEDLFANVLRFGNDLGLFSEEIDPTTGELLGNFPQAFTHIGLINSAARLQGITVGAESPEHDRAEAWPE